MISKKQKPEEQNSISGLVVEYIVAIDVTRVRFPADALLIHEHQKKLPNPALKL